MNRLHSDFAKLIIYEQDKAVLIFDGTKLKSILEDSFTFDLSNYSKGESKLDILADEIQIEQDKAQTIIDIMFQKHLTPDIPKYSGPSVKSYNVFVHNDGF